MNETACGLGAPHAALHAGVGYLQAIQLPGGDFPVYFSESRDMSVNLTLYPCHFATSLIVGLLYDCAAASALCERAAQFIDRERHPGDLWQYWRSDHRGQPWVPVDTDDTALASKALVAMGRAAPDNRSVLLASRNARGMFYTWILPWVRAPRFCMIPLMIRQIPSLPAFRRCFKIPRITVDDVDAGINANVLAWLGEFEGDQAVITQLLRILREGSEASCDRFYDNPVLIRYFFSRALAGRCAEAGELILARAEASTDAHMLDIALTILIRTIWGAPVPDDLVERLISGQAPDGSWPMKALYCGGRGRLGYLNNAPAVDACWRRGGEAFTTAFAVAALNAVGLAGGGTRHTPL